MQASVAKARKYGQRRRISATSDGDDEPADRRGGQLRPAEVRQQRVPEDAEPRRPGDEAGEPCGARRRDVERDEARAADDRGALGGDAHRGAARTTTSARWTWPFASTRST